MLSRYNSGRFICFSVLEEESNFEENGSLTLLIGTSTGEIIKGIITDLESGEIQSKSRIAFLNNEIRSITKLSECQYLISTNKGNIAIFESNKNHIRYIKKNLHGGIWRILVLDGNSFISTGRWGNVNFWKKVNDYKWINSEIHGYQHSIFCLDYISKKEFITNDYNGSNRIWTVKKSSRNKIIDLEPRKIDSTHGNYQHAIQIDNHSFAMINLVGLVSYFEKNGGDYKRVLDISVSSGGGKNLLYKNPYIIGITRHQILFVDFRSLELRYTDLSQCSDILQYNDRIYVLTDDNIKRVDIDTSTKDETLEILKYAKIGLIGHTSVGKSWLCHYLKHNRQAPDSLTSTFGRTIWTIDNQNEYFDLKSHERIIFYDVAGQETQMFTYFPNLSDCDIILAVFKQTDRNTLENVLKHVLELQEYTSTNCKYILVQNFEDDPHNEVSSISFDMIKTKYNFERIISVSSKNGLNIDKLRQIISGGLDWKETRTIIQSVHYIEAVQLLEAILEDEHDLRSTITIKDFGKSLESKIPKKHLDYILENLSDLGMLEYVSKLNQVILKDKRFNNLRSLIPETIGNRNGYCRKDELIRILADGDKQLVAYIEYQIDQLVANMKAIEFKRYRSRNETIIIPRLLTNEFCDTPEKYLDLLPEDNVTSLLIDEHEFPWFRFLSMIRGYNFKIVYLSKKSCLFTTIRDKFCFQLYITETREGRFRKTQIELITGGTEINLELESLIKEIIINTLEIDTKDVKGAFLGNNRTEEESQDSRRPSVFISYVHSSSDHAEWVESLAHDLKYRGGVSTTFDKWEVYGGTRLTRFMQKIDNMDKVIIICDPLLKTKLRSDNESGIKFEEIFIDRRLMRETTSCTSIIPVLKEGFKEESIPSKLMDVLYIDFREQQEYEGKFKELLKSIYDKPYREPPPLGPIPDFVKG